MNIPSAKPFFPEDDKGRILAEIKNCLGSGWLTTHSYVERFEKAFAIYLGVKYAVAVNSGTAAI